jgi:hypothetical protein
MQAKRVVFGLCVVVLTFFGGTLWQADACSVCKCGDQIYFARGYQTLIHGQLLFVFEDFMLRKQAQHPGLLDGVHLPEAGDHEEGEIQNLTQHNLQLMVLYGLTDRAMISLSVPYTNNRISQQDGRFSVRGFADPQVDVIYQLWSGGTSAAMISGGIRLPLGRDNATASNGEIVDSHEQPGTGAFATMIGVSFQHQFGSWPIYTSVQAQANFANGAGYRYGDILRYNVGTQMQVLKGLILVGEVNGRSARRDRLEGQQLDHTGGTALYLSPGVLVPITSNGLSLRVQLQIPVVERLVGFQNEAANLRSGLTWRL